MATAKARHPDIDIITLKIQLHPDTDPPANKATQRLTAREERLTKQKLIAHVNPKFSALFFTCVYAKKNAIVTIAPMIIVPLRPQKNLLLHMNPARIGEGIELRFATA